LQLTSEQIKAGILHSDRPVRDLALGYFAQSLSRDASIMPLAIAAFEQFGRRNAFESVWLLDELVQTPATLRWLMDELRTWRSREDQSDVLSPREVSEWIATADLDLLRPLWPQIATLEDLDSDARHGVAERLRLAELDFESCWDELQRFCEACSPWADEDALAPGYCAIESLARHKPLARKRAMTLLVQGLDEEDEAICLQQALITRLAGELRLEEATPYLIVQLANEVDDRLRDASSRALVQIGSDAVVEALAALFPELDHETSLEAAAILGNIRVSKAFTACLELFQAEGARYPEIGEQLAMSLVRQCNTEGIVPVRQLLAAAEEWTVDLIELRRELLSLCQLSGERFAEFDQWLSDAADDDARILSFLAHDEPEAWQPDDSEFHDGDEDLDQNIAAESNMDDHDA
jgi:hypothetical protein